jgi:oligoendopeptidase F
MSTDRVKREEVYHKITNRRLQDKEVLNALFTKLTLLRHQVSINAGFTNFRDYMFKALGRFDYTPADCFDFHNVAAHLAPADILVDAMRGRSSTWTRVRVNLKNVPEALRTPLVARARSGQP